MQGIIISNEEYFAILDKKLELYKDNSALLDKEKKFIAIAFERQKNHIINNKLIPIKTVINGELYYFIRIISDNVTNEEVEQINKEIKYIVDIEKRLNKFPEI